MVKSQCGIIGTTPLLHTNKSLTNRSSKPLAKFFSSQTSGPSPTRPRHAPSFSNDLLASVNGRTPLLVDPVTGDARLGASTSGREAARVVKFSPEGSGRDLLVFSEVSLYSSLLSTLPPFLHIISRSESTLRPSRCLPCFTRRLGGGAD